MLFAKTLVRKSIASSAAVDEFKKDEKGERKRGDTQSNGTSPSAIAEAGTTAGTQAEPAPSARTTSVNGGEPLKKVVKKEEEFSSKAQVMTLMTTDVDRVSDFSWHLFTFVDSPIEIVIGSYFLYVLLGASAFYGLASSLGRVSLSIHGVILTNLLVFWPINHWASKIGKT